MSVLVFNTAMADVVVDGKLVVSDNCLFENGHHLSVVKDDLVECCGDRALRFRSSGADEITLCLWKASDLRSTPVEGGCLVAANVLQNSPAVSTSETLHPTGTCTVHPREDTKFVTVFCSTYFCSALHMFNHEHVVFRLCANVPDIKQVVLGARTDEAFRWASEESFRTELNGVLCKRTLLCTIGYNFGINVNCFSADSQAALWEQLYVVNCIPFYQGRLTEASEIMVKCYAPQHHMSYRHKHCWKSCYARHYDDVAKAVMVSDFAADIADNCSYLAASELDVSLSKLQDRVLTYELNFAVLMDISRMKSLITFQESQNIFDEFSVAVFSRRCASRLGIMNGNMLKLSCMSHIQQKCDSRHSAVRLSERHQHACRVKVVIACVETSHDDDEVAYISSCTWFNLCSMSCTSLSGICENQPCYMNVCGLVYMTVY